MPLKKHLHKGSFFANVGVLALGTAFAQMIGIIVVPILSRLFTPEDYGVLAIYTAIIAIFSVTFTLRYETSILVPKSDGEAASLIKLVCYCVAAFVLTGSVLTIALPDSIRALLGVHNLGYWLTIAVFAASFTALFVTFQNWQNRQTNYAAMSVVRVVQSACAALIGLVLGYFAVPNGLLIMQTLGGLIGMLLALFLARSFLQKWNEFPITVVARKHENAPKYLLPSAFLDTFSAQFPVLLTAYLFSEALAGHFGMAWRLLMMPMALVGGAIGQVFMQRFSKAILNPVEAQKLLVKSWTVLAMLGFVPLLVMLFFGTEIFMLVLGENWKESGEIARVLAPMVFIMLISSPTSGTYIILGLQRISLWMNVAAVIYRPLCLLAGYYLDNLHLGLLFWVVAEILQNIIYQYIAFVFVNRLIIKKSA